MPGWEGSCEVPAERGSWKGGKPSGGAVVVWLRATRGLGVPAVPEGLLHTNTLRLCALCACGLLCSQPPQAAAKC